MNKHLSAGHRIYEGAGCLNALGSELSRNDGKRPVVFSGTTLHRSAHVHALIEQALDGKPAGWFGGVRAHSPVESIRAAADFMRSVGGDCIIALGGGSAMVTARAAAIALAEGDDFAAMATRTEGDRLVSPRLMKTKLPLFVAPTLPSTAIVKAGSAVLDESTHARLALFDPKTRAAAVFLEPDLLKTADVGRVISASIHTMGMAIEGILSPAAHPLSDAPLAHALNLAWRMLKQVKANPADAGARTSLALAAILCGQGTDHAGGGMCSAIDHAIGARLGIANGACHAVLLPVVLSRYDAATPAQIRLLAAALELPADASLGECADALTQFFSSLGYAGRLRDIGVPQDAIPLLIDDVARDWFARDQRIGGRPEDIIKAAW